MAELLRAVRTPGSGSLRARDFDAFLSYAHRDRQVVSGIQKGLHRVGRRMGQLRALRVFRDDTDLTASPDLWGRITDALDRSRFFVVTLSPRAAASRWVNEEVLYWLQHRGREQLLLVLADGHLQWDPVSARFDPAVSDAAPPALTVAGSLPTEPLFIDVSADTPWDFRSPGFREKLTSLAAPIHGKLKDQLASDDLREQRRFRRLRAAAIAGLIVLTVAVLVAGGIAVVQRQQALHQRDQAIAQLLTAEANDILAGSNSGGDVRAFQELLAARALAPQPDDWPLLHALDARTNTTKIIDTGTGVASLALSPDGHRIATACLECDSHAVQIWNADTGQNIQSLPAGGVSTLAFSPDGHRLVTAIADRGVQMWNADTGQPIQMLPATAVLRATFSPDGHRLVVASLDKTVRVWDADTGQPLGEPLTGHTDVVLGLAFSPDGHRIATASGDQTVRLWDADTDQPLGEPLTGHTSAVTAVVFSPDGHRLATAGADATARLWDADAGRPIGRPLIGHAGPVHDVVFSPDGQRIATASGDDTVRLWDADTGRSLGPPLSGHTNELSAVAFTPDGRHIVSGSADRTVRIWDANQPLTAHTDAVVSVAFSPDGHRLATGGIDTVRMWDANTGQPARDFLAGRNESVSALAFSPDGHRLATAAATGDHSVQLWDVETGQPIGAPMSGHSALVLSVAFSPDGHRLATASADRTVRLWDTDTGQPIGQPLVGHQGGVSGVAFSPDGHLLATGGHTSFVFSVAFSPDGQRVASGSNDHTVRLWPVVATPQMLCSKMTSNMSHVQWRQWISPDIGYITTCPGLPIAPDTAP